MPKKIKMVANVSQEKTIGEGYEEYLLNCQARNLREGTIRHLSNLRKRTLRLLGSFVFIFIV